MLNRSVLPNKPFCFPLTRQMSRFVSFWAAAQSSQCSQPLAMDSGWWWGPFQSPSPALHPFPGTGPRQRWPLPFPGVPREESEGTVTIPLLDGVMVETIQHVICFFSLKFSWPKEFTRKFGSELNLEGPEICCQESRRGNSMWRMEAWRGLESSGKTGKLQIQGIARIDTGVDGLFHV